MFITDLLQPTHLIFVLVIALIFLGPKRLPGAGRALGQGLREFKQSVTGQLEDQGAALDGVRAATPDENEVPSV